MSASGREEIRRSFARQASAFEDPTRAFRSAAVIDWLVANTPVDAHDVVLDAAAGTAIYGRALAPRVSHVVAVDLSPEMLLEGKGAAEAAGLDNVVFQEADVTSLPFPDQSFDRVVCRLAVHHFADPSLPLREMVRVCRAGGSISVVDIVVLDATTQARFNELERLRDPSHARALTRSELRAAIESAGTRVVGWSTWENVIDADRWLEQTGTAVEDAERIRAAWAAELASGPVTGMRPREVDGRLAFAHEWDLVVAEPDSDQRPGPRRDSS
jgi:ubiquinone/menaquinone biosynthesis C-methylase UbiE